MMRPGRFSRVILLILIGMLLASLAWVLSVGIEQRDAVPSSRGLMTKADIEMDRFSMRQMRDGALEWDIRANRAQLFEDRHEASLQDMEATLRTADGLQVRFSGDQALLNTETHDFEIKKNDGDLTVWMNNGYTIEAPSLTWREQQREIVSDRPIRISGQGLQMRGGRLIVKPESQQFTIHEDVHVTVGP